MTRPTLSDRFADCPVCVAAACVACYAALIFGGWLAMNAIAYLRTH